MLNLFQHLLRRYQILNQVQDDSNANINMIIGSLDTGC